MPSRNPFPAIFIVALVIALTVSTIWLFQMGMLKGDIHPPGSTLRASPGGLKLLYESLARLPSIRVSRNYRPLQWLTGQPDRTLVVAGIPSEDFFFMDTETALALERFMTEGGRILMTMNVDPGSIWVGESESNLFVGPPEPDRSAPAHEDTPAWVDLQERWGFRACVNPVVRTLSEDEVYEEEDEGKWSEYAVYSGKDTEAPAGYSAFYDSICFEIPAQEWQAEYRYYGEPTVISRAFGTGRLIMVAHSERFLNDGIFYDRSTSWIAWLLGHPDEIIFDESHLGVIEQRGLMWLAWHHDLQWVITALILGAILYIWRNAIPLLPRRRSSQHDASGGPLTGAAVDGLQGLIERHIDRKSLLSVCGEILKHSPLYESLEESRRREVNGLLNTGTEKLSDAELLRRYRGIVALLKER